MLMLLDTARHVERVTKGILGESEEMESRMRKFSDGKKISRQGLKRISYKSWENCNSMGNLNKMK